MRRNPSSSTLRKPTPAAPPELPGRLRLVITRLARRLRQHAEAPISPPQLAGLATIERRGPLTLGALASIEQVRPPTITAAVSRLEQQGLVRRRIDEDDRRVIRVEMTPAGLRLLERARSRKNAYQERRLRALDPHERATLDEAADILERLLEEQP